MRIIFRLCGYSEGLSSTILHHEAYTYCLDSPPIFTTLLILSITHSGRIMPGKESNIPSRKERGLHSIESKEGTETGGVCTMLVRVRKFFHTDCTVCMQLLERETNV
jgi:hypothetical protein